MSSNMIANRINGKFAPGTSGNPSGRRKDTGFVAHIKELYGENLEKLTDVLNDILVDKRTSPANRIKVVEMLYSRVFGAPKQSVDTTISMPDPITFIPFDEDES